MALVLALLAPAAGATSQFSDSLDGYFDISQWLASRYGFMPIANIITEPAVGFGVAGGLIFLHQSLVDARTSGNPPSISAIGGLATQNGTWGAFGFHQGYYRNDTLRYTGGLGYVSPQLSIYRDVPPFGTQRFGFNMKGWFLLQEFGWRLGDTPVFLGGEYQFFTSEVTFDVGIKLPDIPKPDLDMHIGGLGPIVTYDTRDNTFTPDSGTRARLKYRFHDDWLGSDRRFHRASASAYGYSDRVDRLVVGLRGDAQFAWGDTPFYSLPFINMRGIPAMRYQGDQVYVLETELRWDFVPRWSVIGFGGWGYAQLPNETEGTHAWAAGGGFRYLLARLFHARGGIDVARGPEDWAVYVIFGSAWQRD